MIVMCIAINQPQNTVVLQKRVSDRKLLEEGIGYAATPKISAMNFTRFLTAPFSTFFTCPFFNMCIVSYPLIVRLAVLNDLNPLPGLTSHFMNLCLNGTDGSCIKRPV